MPMSLSHRKAPNVAQVSNLRFETEGKLKTRPTEFEKNGNNPTLLFGYGGVRYFQNAELFAGGRRRVANGRHLQKFTIGLAWPMVVPREKPRNENSVLGMILWRGRLSFGGESAAFCLASDPTSGLGNGDR